MKITNKEYIKLIQWPVIVLLTHIIAGYLLGLYSVFSHFDSLMHFAGGMSIAASSFALFEILKKNQHLLAKPLVYLVGAVALTALAAVGWEMMEYLGDKFLGTFMQPSIYDIMKDLTLGILGGLIISLIQIFSIKD